MRRQAQFRDLIPVRIRISRDNFLGSDNDYCMFVKLCRIDWRCDGGICVSRFAEQAGCSRGARVVPGRGYTDEGGSRP